MAITTVISVSFFTIAVLAPGCIDATFWWGDYGGGGGGGGGGGMEEPGEEQVQPEMPSECGSEPGPAPPPPEPCPETGPEQQPQPPEEPVQPEEPQQPQSEECKVVPAEPKYKEAILVPNKRQRVIARYKVVIPVIIPQVRVKIPQPEAPPPPKIKYIKETRVRTVPLTQNVPVYEHVIKAIPVPQKIVRRVIKCPQEVTRERVVHVKKLQEVVRPKVIKEKRVVNRRRYESQVVEDPSRQLVGPEMTNSRSGGCQ